MRERWRWSPMTASADFSSGGCAKCSRRSPTSCGDPSSRRIQALYSPRENPLDFGLRISDCGFRIVLMKKLFINSKSEIRNRQSVIKGPRYLRGETGRLLQGPQRCHILCHCFIWWNQCACALSQVPDVGEVRIWEVCSIWDLTRQSRTC